MLDRLVTIGRGVFEQQVTFGAVELIRGDACLLAGNARVRSVVAVLDLLGRVGAVDAGQIRDAVIGVRVVAVAGDAPTLREVMLPMPSRP